MQARALLRISHHACKRAVLLSVCVFQSLYASHIHLSGSFLRCQSALQPSTHWLQRVSITELSTYGVGEVRGKHDGRMTSLHTIKLVRITSTHTATSSPNFSNSTRPARVNKTVSNHFHYSPAKFLI